MRRAWTGAALALCLLVSAVALAQPAADAEVIRAFGAASIDDADARAHAIDRAFARAVSSAVDALVATAVRREHDDAIRDKLVRRARLFVARYQIVQEGDDGSAYRVELDVWVSFDKITTALEEAGIRLDAPPPASAPATRARPRLVVLLVANVGGTASATFGRSGGDGGTVGRALARELGEYGFEIVGAAGVAAAVAGSAGERLPLTDEAAMELARQVGAGGAVIVGAEVGEDGAVRGTRLRGARGAASVRVLDVDESAPVIETEVTVAGYGETADRAVEDSAAALGRAVVGASGSAVQGYWPAAVVSGRGVVVEIVGADRWEPVRELQRTLEGAPGISAVEVRRLRRGYVALEVVSELSAARVAKAATAAKLDPGAIEVRTAGDGKVIIEVRAPVVSEEQP